MEPAFLAEWQKPLETWCFQQGNGSSEYSKIKFSYKTGSHAKLMLQPNLYYKHNQNLKLHYNNAEFFRESMQD